jgi:hypothetical protein
LLKGLFNLTFNHQVAALCRSQPACGFNPTNPGALLRHRIPENRFFVTPRNHKRMRRSLVRQQRTRSRCIVRRQLLLARVLKRLHGERKLLIHTQRR